MENEVQATGSFADLTNYPEELILKIFSYLEFDDLCRAGRVHSRWYDLSRCRSLWETVDCHDPPLTPKQIGKLIKILGEYTKHLRIRGIFLDREVPDFSLLKENCYKLETLLLECVSVAHRVTLRDLPNTVTVLSFCKCDLCVDDFFHEYDRISNAPQIKVLNFTDCEFFAHPYLSSFSECNLSGLQELYLSECNITDDGLEKLADAITELRVLDLEDTLVRGGENVLSKLSESCIFLEELYLGGTPVTDEGLRTIRASGFPKLRKICLQGTKTSYLGHRYLLSVVPTLEYVNENSRVDVMEKIIINGDAKVCCHFFVKMGLDVSELPGRDPVKFKNEYRYAVFRLLDI